jgi:hypothetical protein
MKWTKKTYQRELKKGYWDLEPHFNYFCLLEGMSLFETFVDNKMDVQDVKSALYGEFVCRNKPIKKGFYEYLNLISKIAKKTIENVRQGKIN